MVVQLDRSDSLVVRKPTIESSSAAFSRRTPVVQLWRLSWWWWTQRTPSYLWFCVRDRWPVFPSLWHTEMGPRSFLTASITHSPSAAEATVDTPWPASLTTYELVHGCSDCRRHQDIHDIAYDEVRLFGCSCQSRLPLIELQCKHGKLRRSTSHSGSWNVNFVRPLLHKPDGCDVNKWLEHLWRGAIHKVRGPSYARAFFSNQIAWPEQILQRCLENTGASGHSNTCSFSLRSGLGSCSCNHFY